MRLASCEERREVDEGRGAYAPSDSDSALGSLTVLRFVLMWPALFSGTTACGEGTEVPDPQVADSAGVRIVVNGATDVPRVVLDPEPLLDLGTVDEEGPEQFYRVSGARLLDGELIVANGGSSEVRVFGPDGEHVRSFGSAGEGPGEFGFAGRFWLLADDSLAFWDSRHRRVSIFDDEGVLGRVVSFDGAALNPRVVTIATDGRVVLADDRYDFSEGEGFRMMYTDFVLHGTDGSLLDTLPSQPLAEIGVLDGERGMAGSPLFGARTVSRGDGSSYWVGTGRAEEVRRFAVDGRLEMIVRWPPIDRTVDDQAAALELERRLTEAPERVHAQIRQAHAAQPVSDEFPTLGDLMPTTGGGVWVQEFRRPGRDGPLAWKIFDAEGVLVGTVRIPAEMRILEIGHDHLVAVERDELDVEHVRVYGLSEREGQ